MLEKLGSALKGVMDKLTGKGYVDKALLEDVTKDIQRSLLASDVDVKLVFSLTQTIKKRSLEEKPPAGITQKEHVVKVVYDELVRFLGAEAKHLPIQKTKILLMGLFGSGKCVHPESEIVLADGEMVRIKDLYDRYALDGEIEDDEGFVVDISSRGVTAPSFDPLSLKIEPKRVTHLWKLRGKELLKVKLDAGNDFFVRVTPEHPFFVLRDGVVIQTRADSLLPSDFVAVPRRIDTKERQSDMLQAISHMNLLVSTDRAKDKALSGYSTLKEANAASVFPRNYCKFTALVKRGFIPIKLLGKHEADELRLRLNGTQKCINLPLRLTNDLAEFVGYLIGDGHMEKRYAQITTADNETVERIHILSRRLFGTEPVIKRDKRNNVYDIRITSTTLVAVLNTVFEIPVGRKGKEIAVPRIIATARNGAVRSFLRAYFDCDSHADKRSRQIELVSESERLISTTASLLLRFGICSTKSNKFVNGVPYWRMRIRARSAERFAEVIGFNLSRKQVIADTYRAMGVLQGCGKEDMIPLLKLGTIRRSLGFSIGEIQETCNSYGTYEKKGAISRESLGHVVRCFDRSIGVHYSFLKGVEDSSSGLSQNAMNSLVSYHVNAGTIEEVGGMLILTETGLRVVEEIGTSPKVNMTSYLKALSESDVTWLAVKNVERIENPEGFVYDLTVEDNHSFIADNVIVHNTTTAGKLARYYQKKGLKPVLVACDTFRPAAYEQLAQVGASIGVPVLGDPKAKNSSDVLREALKQTDKYDVVIVDSSGRDALNREMIEEVKALNALLKPEEKLMVIPADLGQQAGRQAKAFQDALGITGVIVTKMDGTAKGGGALSACAATGAPVRLIGVGEKMDAIEEYDPKRFVSRLIGFGDLEGLLAKAREIKVDEKQVEKIASGDFTLDEFYGQMKQVKGMGSITQLAEMIPGLGKLIGTKIPKEELEKQEVKMEKFGHIIGSMTPEERKTADLNASRMKRIAKGSGTSEADVRELLKMYEQSKKMMKAMGGGGNRQMRQMMKQFGMK